MAEWAFEAFTEPLGNHLWVLLTVDPDGSSNDELHLVTSHDAGRSFEAPERVSQDLPGAHDITSIGMTIATVWQWDLGGDWSTRAACACPSSRPTASTAPGSRWSGSPATG